MNFFTELFNRFKLEAPKFHKKLIAFGKWLLAVAAALALLPAGYEHLFPNSGIDLSSFIKISSYIGLAGFIISTVAGTAVKDPDYSTLDQKKDVNL